MNPNISSLTPTPENQWFVDAFLDFLNSKNRDLLDICEYGLFEDAPKPGMYLKVFFIKKQNGLLIVGHCEEIVKKQRVERKAAFFDPNYKSNVTYRTSREEDEERLVDNHGGLDTGGEGEIPDKA
jgi:hypothetical protein